MRGKIKSRKIKIILIVGIIAIIVSLFVIFKYNNNSSFANSNYKQINEKEISNIELDEDEKDEINTFEEILDNKGEESATVETKKEVSNTPKTNTQENQKKSSVIEKKENNNTNNESNNPTVSNEQSNNNSNQASAQTQPTVDLSKVVSTNDINYGIHKGIVEFSTNSGCEKAGNDIVNIELNQVIEYNAEHDNTKDVDIRYPACYQVTSQANTIMGYYLNIYCESGNCNRYKSLINISNYD
ncbi:MAG: hypothetical protein IJH20_01795 [Bacilli bacterium]|nr:hypothetical protein [Bacilli bacterium]